MIAADGQHRTRSLAAGEFHYIVNRNENDGLSAWLYVFKSIRTCAITLPPDASPQFMDLLGRMEWREPRQRAEAQDSGT